MRRILLSVCGTLCVSLLIPIHASAASLSVSPGSISVTSGDIVRVSIFVDSEGQAINSASATLHFPTDYLQASSISTSNSIFPLWVEQPSFSNSAGEVMFDGGLPNPGYIGSHGMVMTIVFVAKQTGTATLAFTDGSVLANDGLGTNVLNASTGAAVSIQQSTPEKDVTTPPPQSGQTTSNQKPASPTSGVQNLLAPTISSPLTPDQRAWYSTTTAMFVWTLPTTATAVQTLMSTHQGRIPSVLSAGAITSRFVDSLTDGTWYFTMRYKVGSSWSDIGEYVLNIDTTPPILSASVFTYDPDRRALIIRTTAHDERSGIARYALMIDQAPTILISPTEFAEGVYVMPYDVFGEHVLTFVAYDAAGNSTTVHDAFFVPRPVIDQVLYIVGPLSITFRWLFIFLLVISVISFCFAIETQYRLWKYRASRMPVDREIKRAIHRGIVLFRDEVEKSFSLLETARSTKELKTKEANVKKKFDGDIDDLETHLAESVDARDK